jgi:tetratricopeptide (TPR) repeat protein
MRRARGAALMVKHIVLIVTLTFVALAAGVAMVPGEREQWTMLWRDGQNQQALRVLEQRYNAGQREPDAVLHLYKLYMSFSDIDRATQVMQQFVADHPGDPAVLALLARHYGDTQNKVAEIKSLEDLFALAPSLPTAQVLLSYYRLEGQFEREEILLRNLLTNQMITANDAERLGLLLASTGDLFGARDALIRFDEISNPERILGRLALFDVLVQIGEKTEALTRAASWFGYWRKSGMHRGTGQDMPAGRLIRLMLTVDEAMARKLICEAQEEEQADNGTADRTGACEASEPAPPAANTGAVSAEPREGTTRRRRR